MKRFGSIFLGLLITLGGLACIVIGLVGAYGDAARATRFLAGTAAIPFGIMLLEIGLAAIWFASRNRHGGVMHPANLPPWWVSALLFAASVLGGWLALRFEQWWLFFPLATVAVFAPIAAAGRLGMPQTGVRPSWSRLLVAFAWGALVTPVLAITLQLVALIGAVVAVGVGVSSSGQQNIQLLTDTWTYRLQGRDLSDTQTAALLQFVLQQPVVLAVGAAVLVFAGPASEELVKFGAVPIFSRTRRAATSPPPDSTLAIFLIGLASGLGFAATENIFYVAQAQEGGWWRMALVRAVTPMMHGTATALFALGWARQAQQPRSWALLRGALGALGLHGGWNLFAGLVILGGAFAGAQTTTPTASSMILIAAVAAMGGLLILSIVILLRQRRRLAREVPEVMDMSPPMASSTQTAAPMAARALDW